MTLNGSITPVKAGGGSCWAIVPLKSLALGKSRLAPALPLFERRRLTLTLLRRTLSLLRDHPAVAETLVISADPLILAWAERFGGRTLVERGAAGLNGAVREAKAVAAVCGVERVLVIPADLPYLTQTDVSLLLRAAAPASTPNVVICSDRSGTGTNGLLLPAAAHFRFQYGPGSYQAHRQEAARVGLLCRSVDIAGFKFDLDTPAELEQLAADRIVGW